MASMIASAMRFENAMPSKRVDADPAILLRDGSRRILERALACDDRDLLGFLRALPEEQIGADRRPEDRDDGEQRGRSEIGSARTSPVSASWPIDVHQQDHAHISEQAERQPFQHMRILAVGNEELQADAAERRRRSRRMLAAAAPHELGRRGHRDEVRADVEDVGDEQDRDEERDDGVRERLPQILAPSPRP